MVCNGSGHQPERGRRGRGELPSWPCLGTNPTAEPRTSLPVPAAVTLAAPGSPGPGAVLRCLSSACYSWQGARSLPPPPIHRADHPHSPRRLNLMLGGFASQEFLRPHNAQLGFEKASGLKCNRKLDKPGARAADNGLQLPVIIHGV